MNQSKEKATAIKNLIAASDGNPIYRGHKALSALYKIDASPIKRERFPSPELREEFWDRVIGLKRAEARCRKKRGRSWIYQFLNVIFKFRDRLESWEEGSLGWHFIKRHTRPAHQHSYDEYRILIDVASDADEKAKSRWCQALRYADKTRGEWQDEMTLKEFFIANGGITGCADKIAKRRKSKRTIRTWA